jgi:hypothetical protein
MSRIRIAVLAVLAVPPLLLAAPAARPAAAETQVVCAEGTFDLAAFRARAAARRAAAGTSGEQTVRSLAAPALGPSGDQWLVPFVVDTGNPVGTTTLLTVRNETEVGGVAAVLVEFFDAAFVEFHSVVLPLSPDALQSFNLRDQPGLPGGLARGFARVTPGDGDLVSVDYFVVTPGEDFATGGLGIDFVEEQCLFWRSRILAGGPFTGGTRFTFLVNGPLGGDPMTDEPTVALLLYDEAGLAAGSCEIFTDDWVFEVDAADLIAPAATLFGSIELVIDSLIGGGYLIVEIGAEGRYSVGFSGVCKDGVPTSL